MSTKKIQVEITSEILSSEICIAFVLHPTAGSVIVFEGVVRSQTQGREVIKLEYEAAESMAKKVIEDIAKDCHEKWNLIAISVMHRIGILYPLNSAVLVAVSSAHRQDGFSATQYIIDRLKAEAPIWKKEYFSDGTVWVNAHP
jgi:molybdopterin synthase catalytic subunit